MKSKLVDTITSNEGHVRLRIFDGDLPADEAVQELLTLEKAQHESTRRELKLMHQRINETYVRALRMLKKIEAGDDITSDDIKHFMQFMCQG